MAPSIGWLIAARALQAAGCTMLNPVAMAIVANTFTDRIITDRGTVSGWWCSSAPTHSRSLTCTFSQPELRVAQLDVADVVLVLSGVVAAIIESTRLGWTSPVILGLLAMAVLGVLGILYCEPRRTDPLLELRFLHLHNRHNGVTVSNGLSSSEFIEREWGALPRSKCIKAILVNRTHC